MDIRPIKLTQRQIEDLAHNAREYARLEKNTAAQAAATRDYSKAVDHDLIAAEYSTLSEKLLEGEPFLGIVRTED